MHLLMADANEGYEDTLGTIATSPYCSTDDATGNHIFSVEAIFAVPDATTVADASARVVAVAVARFDADDGAVTLDSVESRRLRRRRAAGALVAKPGFVLVAGISIELASAHASNEDEDALVDSDNGSDGSGREVHGFNGAVYVDLVEESNKVAIAIANDVGAFEDCDEDNDDNTGGDGFTLTITLNKEGGGDTGKTGGKSNKKGGKSNKVGKAEKAAGKEAKGKKDKKSGKERQRRKGKGKKCKKSKKTSKFQSAAAAGGSGREPFRLDPLGNPTHLAALSTFFLVVVVGATVARRQRGGYTHLKDVSKNDDVDGKDAFDEYALLSADERTPLNTIDATAEYALPVELDMDMLGAPTVDSFIDDELDRYMGTW